MRAFSCGHCGQLVFFENTVCLRCSTPLGFVPEQLALVALEGPVLADHRSCSNQAVAECNWMVDAQDGEELCRSCRLTAVRPSDRDAEGLTEYATAEAAKRWVLFQLLDLGLPIDDGLSFDLLSGAGGPVVTGHDDGKITLDLEESDAVQREVRRAQLDEPYRTVLGHFRHELGHYYQPVLIWEAGEWERCRQLFGDDQADYQSALDRHYEGGPPADWDERYVSAYATMHPMEDWAETFAHYLHISDTLQTAADFGMTVRGPQATWDTALQAAPRPEAGEHGFPELVENWLPLSYALNAVNRSMGRGDLYPFTLAPVVIAKLAYIHERVQAVGHRSQS